MIDSERAIIGAVLVDNMVLKKLYRVIKTEMFTNDLAQDSYRIMLHMYEHGEKITLIELAQKLENDVRDKQEILHFLMECGESVNTTAEVGKYGNVLINEWRARELKKAIEHVSLKPKDANASISELQDLCEKLKINEKPKYKSIGQVARDTENNYFVEKKELGVKTGFYELDEILVTLAPKDVTILGARPSVGKSIFALQIAENVANSGKRVALFNLEMSEEQIYERLLAKNSGIDLIRIRKANSFVGDEEERYRKGVSKLQKMNNLLIYSGSFTANEIKSECRNQNFDLVIIDYLQLVKADKNYNNRVAEVGEISKTIKSIAMELNVPILALSQLNRLKKATEEPELADLRESGDIEQDASNVLFLWNMDEAGIFKAVKIEKNRQGVRGGTTKIPFQFIGKNMEFISTPKKFYQVEQEIKTMTKCSTELNNLGSKNEVNPFEDM